MGDKQMKVFECELEGCMFPLHYLEALDKSDALEKAGEILPFLRQGRRAKILLARELTAKEIENLVRLNQLALQKG